MPVLVTGPPDGSLFNVYGADVTTLWRTQPHLRTVVSFLARNVAHCTLHTFTRSADDSRERDRTSPLARALADPGDGMTGFDLVYATVVDLSLYDRAYWVPFIDPDGTPRIRRIPPNWVTPQPSGLFGVSSYEVWGFGQRITLRADQVIDFTGYSPDTSHRGSPTVEALRATLQEQIEATTYRLQVWKRGGRVSSVLQRPADAPEWSDSAREAFREDWYSTYTGTGPRAGGTPILEDGMTLNRIDFSAKEQEFVEAAKLSLATVASAYHVNPTMIGLLDNANFSNVREFRKMLYGDTLGPLMAQMEARIQVFLVPWFGMDPTATYVEFNVGEKLQGTFEEQAAVMQTMVGAPILTRNEARARFNLPAIPGGDELVTPLNVLIGGQASPTDSGSQNRAAGPAPAAKGIEAPATKAAITEPQREQITRVLSGFWKRQGDDVLAAIADGGDWWDGDRWDRELAKDLTAVSHTIADILGKATAESLGYADGYHPDRTLAFIQTVMERKAANINATTQKALQDAIAADDGDPASVYADTSTRAADLAIGLGTFTASFATGEAARQIAYDHGGSPTKTWITGSNPRSSHAAVNGETVPIDQPFSNGCMWPADGPDVDEVAGCNCSVEISF